MTDLSDPTIPANCPVCEQADDAFLPTGVDLGPCSEQCPVHGPRKRLEAQHRELADLVIDRFAEYVADNYGDPSRMTEAQLDSIEGTRQWQTEREGIIAAYWDAH